MTKRVRTTIHDVARAAGVSHQTVSNVLNGRGRVGEATRARVDAAVQALDYRPHAGAASLRTKRSGRLAYPMSANDFGPLNTIMLEFIHALSAAAGACEHHLVLATGPDDIERLVRSGAVDAVVLANLAERDPRVSALAARGIPFACFGRTAADLPQCWVDVDNRAGTRAATGHVLAVGHRDVAFLGYTPQGGWDEQREAGYRDAMTAALLPARLCRADLDPADARRAVDELLGGPTAPTAVVAGSDVLASELYAGAARHGRTIGVDLAVTGFDGSVTGRLLTPSLTTVAIPMTAIAERLVARVLAELDGRGGAPGELLAPELAVGDSSGRS